MAEDNESKSSKLKDLYVPSWVRCSDKTFCCEWYKLHLGDSSGDEDNMEVVTGKEEWPLDLGIYSGAVVLGSRIYALGGRGNPSRYPDRRGTPPLVLDVFCLDVLHPEKGKKEWRSAPSLKQGLSFPWLIALCDKIYAFDWADGGGGCWTEAQVFDPTPGAGWNHSMPPVPPLSPIPQHWPMLPVVPDPDRERFLTVLQNAGGLYAYYPFNNTWECLKANQSLWFHHAVVVGDVLYGAYSTYVTQFKYAVSAYDLVNHSKLIIDYDDPVFDEQCQYGCQAILHLGNDDMCLVTLAHLPTAEDSILLSCVKFKALRIHDETNKVARSMLNKLLNKLLKKYVLTLTLQHTAKN